MDAQRRVIAIGLGCLALPTARALEVPSGAVVLTLIGRIALPNDGTRALFDMAMLNAIHDAMHRAVQQAGGRIDAIFFCPHTDEAGCDCRKPKPGMLLEIARRLNVDLEGVPVVGDSLRDLQAAAAAGALPVLVLTGKGRKTREAGGLPRGTAVHSDLAAFAAHLESL